jgi:broad specificity phosphatase PhoE
MLLFVRHATVELRLDRPAATWELDDAGRAAAEELARRLAPVPRVLSSPEPKAVATAAPLARLSRVEIELDEQLREVERASNLPDYEAHRSAVRAYLAGEPVDGWEPRDSALARFRAALVGVDGAVVVTHATVLSLFLGYSFEEWERIRLPDLIEWQP